VHGCDGPGVVAAVRDGRAERRWELLETYDVVIQRSNPADRFATWTERVGDPAADFGRLLRERGVRVINDPDGARLGGHPIYLHDLKEEYRPRTIITRDVDRIRAFLRDLGRPAVVKPLEGYGGDGVFFVDGPLEGNLPAAVGLLARQGLVVAQERIAEALTDGDKRVLLWRGEPFEVRPGQPSVYRRRRAPLDLRNNVSAGGTREPCDLDERDRATLAAIRDRLVRDGLLFVGADLAGGRLLELNVRCPAGLEGLGEVYGADGADVIAASMEELGPLSGRR
jgi:glutathione synthase